MPRTPARFPAAGLAARALGRSSIKVCRSVFGERVPVPPLGTRAKIRSSAKTSRAPGAILFVLTPAVYPRLVEFLHFDIQSTGQKSHCVNTVPGRRNALF